MHDFDWMSLSLGFSYIPLCRDDTSAAFTHKLIKGDFMIFRLCENQRSVHSFLGEHGPLRLRSYSFGGASYYVHSVVESLRLTSIRYSAV